MVGTQRCLLNECGWMYGLMDDQGDDRVAWSGVGEVPGRMYGPLCHAVPCAGLVAAPSPTHLASFTCPLQECSSPT